VIRVLARELPTSRFAEVAAEDLGSLGGHDLVWVDIETADQEEISSVFGILGFEALDSSSGDRDYFHVVDERTHSVRLMLAVPQLSAEQRLTIDPIHVLVGEHVLVTDHDDPVPGIDRLWNEGALDIHRISTPATLAAALSQSAGREMIPLIEELEVRIDGLEDLALASDPRILTESQVLRRDLITLRRITGRQRDVLDDLSESIHSAIGNEGRQAFGRAAEYIQRMVEALDSARSLLTSALDTYRGAVADETNEIIRLLTVFSAIVLPLTLITGVFGMNFVNIPMLKDPSGFWLWIGIMAVVAISLWTFFVKKGFIGGPRLRELPKAVGLGIVQVGTAPVKAIATGVGSTVRHLDPRRTGNRSTEPEEKNQT
jgi:magnesium transporter